jgi:uncharacterized protein
MAATPVQTTLTALDLAQAGRFGEIRDLFAPQLQAMVPPEALKAAWDAELGRQGAVASVGTPVSEPAHAGVVVVKVPVTCECGGFALIASVSEQGQLAGLQLTPPGAAAPMASWEPPAYADSDAFVETEVTLGSGPLAVTGTLTVPNGPRPHAGVVLVAGSGSIDRDETIGRNKPFKDIAWGLASRAIVTLRFDKVTYAHARELENADDFTLADEYLPDAIAAIKILVEHPAVDGNRVFLLGHSLGGTVTPRIAAADKSVAGLIILAGGAQPLHWVIVRQMRYLASLRPETESATRPAIEDLAEKASMVDSPDLSPSTPASRLPLGAPASYWLDLRDYNPVEVAATVGKPMLILQGGRDYQATVADDLSRWEAGLGERPNVTIRVYPEHNHLFTPGSGPSSPEEYEPAQHVDGTAIADIAAWLATVPG